VVAMKEKDEHDYIFSFVKYVGCWFFTKSCRLPLHYGEGPWP
jgi:hypothetical protein